jgi:hypothetical protein
VQKILAETFTGLVGHGLCESGRLVVNLCKIVFSAHSTLSLA